MDLYLYIVLLDRLAGPTPLYQLGFRDQHSGGVDQRSRTSNARLPNSTGLPSANGWLWRRRTSKRPKRSVSCCSMGPPEITGSELECLAARGGGIQDILDQSKDF